MFEWAARQRGYEETTATDAYRDATRRPGESLAVYAFRLAALFEDAYPEADKQCPVARLETSQLRLVTL
ncbi:hypothetical protein FJT64_007143 [Amphibalanus amphitrite]|uniref:Uncharacterized protein n=1 Tax=Amphibalanus amphitrite TaxID=1232801 RepID=A0A6A4W0K5_AMPAM|nr:hypothetical protein FJT64_007143 [Amphibalanus amphitrite]